MEKPTSPIATGSPPNSNTICGHVLGLYLCNAERIGPVVVEIESKSPSVGVLMISRGTDARRKVNFCSFHQNPTKL
jgi:hypothetical protein